MKQILYSMLRKSIYFLIGSFMIIACSESDDPATSTDPDVQNPNSVNFDRSAMLAFWADDIIIPGYVDINSRVEALEASVTNFTAAPSEGLLQEVRESWEACYLTWQRVSMFETGPAESADLRLNLNIYPTNVTLIEENVAAGDANLDLSSNRAAKGFPAIDYLIHGLESSDSELVARYSGASGDAYRTYLTALVMDMRMRLNMVLSSWQDNYRDQFIANDGASATASTDRLVNDLIFYYERHLRAGKMGIPGGVFSGSVEAERIEALYAGDLSKRLFLEGFNAVQDFFNGIAYQSSQTGPSLSRYLDALNAVKGGVDLKTIMNDQFNNARTAVLDLGNFEEELATTPPTAFLEAYDEVQRLVPLFKVDMVSAMSINIDFVDADGD